MGRWLKTDGAHNPSRIAAALKASEPGRERGAQCPAPGHLMRRRARR